MITQLFIDGIPLHEWEERSSMLSVPQARLARDRYLHEFGRMPFPDELVAYIAIKEREDQERFVQVQYVGHSKCYTYEILPGTPVKIGDYLQVMSAWSGRPELVRVERLGRGSYPGRIKVAHRIVWRINDAEGR